MAHSGAAQAVKSLFQHLASCRALFPSSAGHLQGAGTKSAEGRPGWFYTHSAEVSFAVPLDVFIELELSQPARRSAWPARELQILAGYSCKK